jgi:HEAT repeat protein
MAPKDVARLWEELRHRDPEEKIDWIRQLAKDPTPDAVEVLLDALEQESWFLRDQAAHALGHR